MSKERVVAHRFEQEMLESVFVGRRDSQQRPTIVLFPTVMGVSELEIGFGRQLVELGYNAMVADLFGPQLRGADRDTMFAAMGRLRDDRHALLRRLQHILGVARGLDEVRSGQMVVAGYCFGGQCALDVARSGEDVRAAVSFHGLFDPPGLPRQAIKAKVVAFHGWDDPWATPETVIALGQELTEGGADWQIHAYGQVSHGFTNPRARDMKIEGVSYNALAAERSWTSFINLLEELFSQDA